MSTPTLVRATGSRWITWKPKARILTDSAESQPTKPSKRSSVGFDGATSGESPKIEVDANPATVVTASEVLNRKAVRLMQIEGVLTVGVWSDLDGPEVRTALRLVEMDHLPLRHLDGDRIPTRYKVRRL